MCGKFATVAREMDMSDKAQSLLLARGWRLTSATRNVLHVLGKTKIPMTVNEISRALEGESHEVDPTTVYRILERLTECGLVHDLGSTFVMCSDPDHKNDHHFLLCVKCHNTEEIFLDYRDSIAKQLASEKNFLLHEVDLLFKGTCSGCTKK